MKLSLIFPAYNEEENIRKGNLDKVLSYLKLKKFDWEIIVVDDGSTDKTALLIEQKYLKNKNIRLIKKSHQGKAFTLIWGIKEAKGDLIGFSDFDLATPIEELDKLLLAIDDGFDIVIGSRNNQRKGAPMLRKIMAAGFMILRDIFINLEGLGDTQCGFKIFKKEVVLRIINNLRVFKTEKIVKGPSVSAGFDLEFLYLAKKMAYQIKEVPVEWIYAETRRVNFFKDSLETLKDILKIKTFELFNKYRFS
jgi:glycosyltransferase involved in cell wall biosynthesis